MKESCREYQKLISSYSAGIANDRECSKLISHVRSCPECYRDLETEFLVNYAISYLDKGETSAVNLDLLLKKELEKTEHMLKMRMILRVISCLFMCICIVTMLLIGMVCLLPDFLPQFASWLQSIGAV